MSHTRQTNPATSNPEPFLPCERLDVYRVALEFRQSLGILDTVRNISALRDQIFRASDSIVLNIAEGAGRIARADKRRHYSYALGSAMECGAALALLFARGALRDIAYLERRMMIIRVIQMLYRLAGPPR
jgi:four helix bundle protein